ncbi:MAG: MaoC family dehydratase [Steroidobacteraceae bacterium]
MDFTEIDVAALPGLNGKRFAPTDWIVITQQRVDAFADCTDDHQFIHVDPERAARESPFGGPIAHGFLTLSLIAAHRPPDFPRFTDLGLTINYGLDKVRFLTPVRVGARVRLQTRVVSAELREPGRVLLKQEKTLEIEGAPKPGYIAEQLTLFVARTFA